MTTADERILGYIGRDGRDVDEVAAHFPGFKMMRLIRADLVDVRIAGPHEVEAHLHVQAALRFVLTPRGAAAVGIELPD